MRRYDQAINVQGGSQLTWNAGLSLLFFILSLLGNLTYGAGILFHSTESAYVLKNLPWLIGSLGTMVEDVTIFAQFHMYKVRDQSAPDEAVI